MVKRTFGFVESLAELLAFPLGLLVVATKWPNNNVLESLMYAAPEMDTAFVASYSDIVYRRSAA